MTDILSLFHHIHHRDGEHLVHHCGGKHAEEVNSKLDYTIEHCGCGKHRIDKEKAVGHATDDKLESMEIVVSFIEQCPEGGWHLESGIKS